MCVCVCVCCFVEPAPHWSKVSSIYTLEATAGHYIHSGDGAPVVVVNFSICVVVVHVRELPRMSLTNPGVTLSFLKVSLTCHSQGGARHLRGRRKTLLGSIL